MIAPITDPSVLDGYLTDASNLRGHADALLRPRSTAEVAEIVRHCQEHGIPLTIAAARTSTVGSPVPLGGWLMSMEGLDQVLAIGHDTATAQGGVLLGALQDAIEATGRFFPPDPTSRHECTLGAAIACNASGARTFRYGPTRPWVEALEVVLPSGEVIEAHRGDPIPADWPLPRWEEPAVKTAAGYAPPRDLVDVFVGQEGTLGVITRATVRLTDLPADVIGIVAFFPDRPTCVAFVERLRAAVAADPAGPLSPRCIEYFDGACLDLARQRLGGVPEGAGAALFCEQEVQGEASADASVSAWWEALGAGGALADDTILATDDSGRRALHALRHAIPAGINEEAVRNGMPKVGTDLAVPAEHLSEMMALYEHPPVRSVLFGHIGDSHLHLNLLPRTPEELATAKAYYDDLARRAIALGGTVSAEHGIGKRKTAQLGWMVGDEVLASFVALKRRLDPRWILGRGTMLPVPPDVA
jgi:FAD/FMN-containing dehydrogenase